MMKLGKSEQSNWWDEREREHFKAKWRVQGEVSGKVDVLEREREREREREDRALKIPTIHMWRLLTFGNWIKRILGNFHEIHTFFLIKKIIYIWIQFFLGGFIYEYIVPHYLLIDVWSSTADVCVLNCSTPNVCIVYAWSCYLSNTKLNGLQLSSLLKNRSQIHYLQLETLKCSNYQNVY